MQAGQDKKAQSVQPSPERFAARSVQGDSELLRAFLDFYRNDPNILGAGDLMVITGGKPAARAGLVAAVLSGCALEDGERAILRYRIIIPPSADLETYRTLIWQRLARAMEVLSGQELQDDMRKWFEERLLVVQAADLAIASVVAIIEAQEERTAVIITDAAIYRDPGVALSIPPGAKGPLAPEDLWAPQLHALAARAIPLAHANRLYLAFDANELMPIRAELRELLHSIEHCGVMSAESKGSADTIITKRVGQWDAWLKKGHVGLALADIEALPAKLDSHKAFLRVQLLAKAGLTILALADIRQHFAGRDDIDSETRARLAMIAAAANADILARELLEPAIDELDGVDELESALRTFEQIGNSSLGERVADRLEGRFPGSRSAARFRREELLRARDYAGVAAADREADPARADFYDALANAFGGAGVPDYLSLIASGHDEAQKEAFRMASVQDALGRGLTPHAFELVVAVPASENMMPRWERTLLNVLERCFLDLDPAGNPPIEAARIEESVRVLVQRLADNPRNTTLRFELGSLLRHNLAGRTGLALLAKLCIDAAERPVQIDKGVPLSGRDMNWVVAQEAFIDSGLAWLKQEDPVIIGRLAMPTELLTVDPDDAVGSMSSYIERMPLGDENDVEALRLFVTLSATIAPHTRDPDVDLRLFRLASGKLASAGFPQHGRDLVETVIEGGAETPRRRRLAWLALSDVYHRSRDFMTSLLALACTYLADSRVDEEESWQEAYALARLLRDIGLVPMAYTAIDRARQVLDAIGYGERYGHRVDLLELQVRQGTTLDNDAEAIAALLADATRIGKAVIAELDQTAPSAIALGQMILAAEILGLTIPEEARSTFAELSKWAGGNLETMVRAASAMTPGADDIARLAATLPPARYSEDVGYDTHQLAMLAGRAITSDTLLQNPGDAHFVLDILADWGAALPGWDEAAAPPRPPARGEPLETAKAVSAMGVAVMQMAFDSEGALVRTLTIEGEPIAVQREPSDRFSREAFRTWSTDFPWRYAYDSSPNLFYTTTEQLRLSEAPVMPTIISASTRLQAFPPNILTADGEFFGRIMPMTAVPSLAWLKGARERNWTGDGRRVAWISTAESEDGRVTMPLLAQRMEEPLHTHGFATDFKPEIPVGFAGATIAIIAAHGDLHPENSFFQRVSDEGRLKITSEDMAAALRNIGVVVLFVCSGGRADKHPGANTTIGLAKEILDRGSAAVIASPWPLDSQVPPHWLPVFLESWTGGATLMQANFDANQAVDKHFALDVRNGLAMTVYGDGLLMHHSS